ncbi:helix-turn-helix domain-containing protein [Heyndrickxia camelliae]|uniref:HTH cro/C1-type domain-containing protein n=1 Tax=Heyndrickxia camelliae TaxID=1707093 RepID=A0A2N3LE99_9BACI|nr:helix-turn-helix transcriptional regulator [Heyndrickxia camelliae]PKR82873.1 hypothetical protein CWO92_22040 [Heyndrickxia camelliae]
MEYKKFDVLLKKETVDKIDKITMFKNVKDELFKGESEHFSVEDFIVGCVYHYIELIESNREIAGFHDLGRPFKLRNRFKEIIKEKGINQKQLGDMTQINAGNISQILNNHNQPSLDYFLRIWIALECPRLDWCLYREE